MSFFDDIIARNPVSYWRMSTAFGTPTDNIAEGAFTGESFATGMTAPQGLAFNDDQSLMFVVDANSPSIIKEFALSTPGDVSSASSTGKEFTLNRTFSNGLAFKPDGASFYCCDYNSLFVSQYDLSTPWDIATASFVGDIDVSAVSDDPTGVAFKDDGTKMYLSHDGSSSRVFQFSLSTAWDITTATYDSVELNVDQGFGDRVEDLGFNTDGSKLYVLDHDFQNIEEYNLSTPWDLSTAAAGDTLSVSGQGGDHAGLFMDMANLRFWVLTDPAGSAEVYAYEMTGPELYPDSGALDNPGEAVGTVNEAPSLLPSDPDPAADFSGVSGLVEIPHDPAYSIATTGKLSIEHLIDVGTSTAGWQTIIDKGSGQGAGLAEWAVEILDGDTLRVVTFKPDELWCQNSSVPITPGKHLLGIDFTGTDASDVIGINIDGVALTPTTNNAASGTVNSGTANIGIGAESGSGGDRLNDSVVDEMIVYDFNPTEADYASDYVWLNLTPVRAAHTAVWVLRLAAAHAAYSPLRVAAAHTAPIRWGVRRAHTAAWSLLHRLRAAHTAVWDLRLGDPVRAAHTALIPLRVAAAHAAPAPLMAVIRRAHAAVWDLRTAVRSAHTARVPLLARDPVRAAHAAVFSLLGAPRTHLAMAVTLSDAASGRNVPVISWNISAAEGGYLYEGQVEVGADGYGLLAVDQAVTLDLFGEAYALVVESKQRDRRGPAGRRFMIGLRSPTVRFDFPRAEPVTKTFDNSVLARTAVETLLGEPVTWELVNWPIPAFRLAFEEASPIDAARQIVEAPGGTIQTDPDGTLRIRHLYPDSPKKRYADVTPARTVDDQSDVATASESFEPRRLVDRLSIRDTVEGLFRDRMEFEADENDERAGLLRVYPSPWRTNLVVAHTSNASLQLTQVGETTREETEVVEFVAGKADTRFPVDALLAVEWLYVNLGAVTFEHYATELAAGGETDYSLARVTYRTRSIDYRLASPTVDQAQLILREVA